jgi:hypothetical protein
MSYETAIETAERHLPEASLRVERQRELIADLQAEGQSTQQAERVLATFEPTQREFENVLASFRKQTG